MTKTLSPPDEAYKPETWVYVGVRVGADKKPWQRFQLPDGTFRQYSLKRSAHLIIGGSYEVQIARSDDGPVWLSGDPKWAGDVLAIDDDTRRQWTADSVIAETKLAQGRRERNARKQNALDDAIRPLLAVAKAYRLQSDQDALAAYVIRQLHRAWAADGDPK